MEFTKEENDLARQWAENVQYGKALDDVQAAADLILSLPDAWVGADTLRKYISDWREGLATAPREGYEAEMLDDLESLLPAPPTPRTLADMNPEERAECQWMQCDHPALEEPGVILQIWGNGCSVLSREGVEETEALNRVAPRPDLPPMEWPGSEPEDDVASATGGELTTQDVVDECRAVRKERATPESAAPRPEDEPVFDPAYTYRDKDEAVWRYYAPNRVWTRRDSGGWNVGADYFPPAEFAPYTRIEDTK